MTLIEVVLALALLSLIVAATVPMIQAAARRPAAPVQTEPPTTAPPPMAVEATLGGLPLEGRIVIEGGAVRVEWDLEGWAEQ